MHLDKNIPTGYQYGLINYKAHDALQGLDRLATIRAVINAKKETHLKS